MGHQKHLGFVPWGSNPGKFSYPSSRVSDGIRYLNNIVEHHHRWTKRQVRASQGFRSFNQHHLEGFGRNTDWGATVSSLDPFSVSRTSVEMEEFCNERELPGDVVLRQRSDLSLSDYVSPRPDFFEISEAESKPEIPADTQDNDRGFKMAAL